MKKFKSSIFLLTLFAFFQAEGQILDPVTWNFEVLSKGKGEYELVMRAVLEEHWHLYTQTVPESDNSPLPTVFTFTDKDGTEFIGKVSEGKSVTAFEPVLGMELSYFAGEARFTQRIRHTGQKGAIVRGNVEFMTCDDKRCLPPEVVDFEFSIPPMMQVKAVENEAGITLPDEEGILDPVKWNFAAEDVGNGLYRLILTADIDKNWHIYARKLESDEGPVPTEVVINNSDEVEFSGEIRDIGEMKSEYDANFMMELSYYENRVSFTRDFRLKSPNARLKGSVTYMVCDNSRCLPPETVEFDVEVNGAVSVLPEEKTQEISSPSLFSFWSIFTKGFIGGLLALLTPCVFPMIPLTVSFFTKQSKTRAKGVSNAFLYAASIIAIYVLLGYGVTAAFGADALNALSTNVWFNMAFFILLVIFAISFFGAFEITLPSGWINKADSAADRGGLIGIFFMAFTLSLVSFSCTGPIIGTLLVDAAVNGGVQGPLVGMFGFSLALALPFGLFAAFPGWLNSLPSSGGWLNSVKVVLGFLELALALKFLSNADLVVQAGLLKRELFIAIWIAIFALMTAYLLGLYALPHDGENRRISVPRLLFAIASFMFTVYLIPGIWGAPLHLISGFPPPMFYSESPRGIGLMTAAVPESGTEVVGEPEHCPHMLNCFHDYEEGMEYAKKVGKPVMLDFTGWACVNCRKMEEQVWSDPSVLKILRDDLVLISLYVDEKLPLPDAEQVEVSIGKRKKILKTVGNKWSYLQATRYNTNSQPYYVLLDHSGNTLNGSAAYDPDIGKFRNWLLDGLNRFRQADIAASASQ